MLGRLCQQRRCPTTAGCLPSPDITPGITSSVTTRTGPHTSLAASRSYSDLAIQALYQTGQLHAGAALGVLLDPQQTLAAAANTRQGAQNVGVDCTTPDAQRTEQPNQQQGNSQRSGLQQHWQQHKQQLLHRSPSPQQLHHGHQQGHPWHRQLQRPLYVKGHVEQQTQLIRACSSIEQLQAFCQTNMQQLPPQSLAAAMQQLTALHRVQQQGEQQLVVETGSQRGCRASSSVNALAEQLSRTLLQRLPSASAQALTAFLAAAAAGRIMLPSTVLDGLASHLVHSALRAACLQHKQQQQLQTRQQVQQPHAQQQQQRHQLLLGQGRGAAAGQPHLASRAQAAPAAEEMRLQRPHTTATAAWALAQLQVRQPAVWAELASLAGEQLEQLGPQDCVMLCWCLARARHYDPRLYHALLQRLFGRATQLSPDSISCVLWSCARVGHYHHAAVSALVLAAAGSMERFSPRALSRCLWSCVALRHYEPRLLRAARVGALARMHLFEPHSLVLVMCALAKFGVQDEQLAAAVAGQARQCLGGFTMQGLANMAWAAAKLQQQQHEAHPASSIARHASKRWRAHRSVAGQEVQHLLAGICVAAVQLLPSAKPQEVCNLLWACAILKHRHQPCLEAACSRLVAVAEDASPRDLAQAVWALEVLRYRRKAAQQVLVLQALNKLHLFGPQALSNLAWAVASSAMQPPRGLPAAIAQQFQLLLPESTPQGIATTLWALSKMGKLSVSQETMHAAGKYILANITCYNAQDLCNVAMVCCKAGYKDPTLLQGLANAAVNAASVTLELQHSSTSGHSYSLSSAARRLHAQPAAAAFNPPVTPPSGSVSQQPGTPLAVAAHGVMRQKQLTPQAVCNLLWAFAGLGWHEPLLMQQLQQLAVQLIKQGQLQPERIAGLLQGFALVGESCEGLFQALAHSGPARRANGQQTRPAASSSCSTSCAISNSMMAPHAGTPKEQLQQQLYRWPADSLALLIWAATVSGEHQTHGGLVAAALQQLQGLSASGLPVARRVQLHLALTLLATEWGLLGWGEDGGLSWSDTSSSSSIRSRVSAIPGAAAERCNHQHPVGRIPDGVSGSVAASVLSGKLARQCAAAYKEQEARSTLSRAEEEVAQALQSMGLKPLVQRWLQPVSGAYGTEADPAGSSRLAPQAALSYHTLRLGVGVAGADLGNCRRPVCIDVLPAAAVSSSWPPRVLGKTALRQRCLQAAGWEVVTLTWQEWEGCGQQRGAQRQLLRKLLQLDTAGSCIMTFSGCAYN